MSEHIVSKKLYFVIFGALMVLTVLTVWVANIDLGSEKLNTVVALAIATTKAVLVVLYFMHVRYSSRLTWVVVAGGFLWLVIMVGLTMSDYLTRGLLTYPR
ncbi:MAG TPA: cytochrome C oxidase subunit IV family protein [Pyrinomonadaceae bacterium]|jgi:cytochrome c oxidase subunit 4|nr:cytochrome C oxidase subunit IV family protein [Pyrinomonadaceae bacterium]